MKHKQLNRKSLTGARAQVRATGEIVFVKKGKRIKNPWGWYSQMWNFTEDGRVFHDDELISPTTTSDKPTI